MEAYTNEKIDENSTDSKDKTKLREWQANLQSAKLASKWWVECSDDSIREYLAGLSRKLRSGADLQANGVNTSNPRYPLWWSTLRTVQPALYSRVPVPVGEKVFQDLSDNDGRLGSICMERLAKYLMQTNEFDRTMQITRDMFLHSGRTTTRVLFCADIGTKIDRVQVMRQQVQNPDGSMQEMVITADGQPVQEEVLRDEQGEYIEREIEDLADYGVKLEPVHYRDLLHTPNARWWEEITWISFRALMTKAQVTKRFGEEVANTLNYSTLPNQGEEDREQEQIQITTKYAEIHEIWDKTSKKVYWYCDECKEGFLDEKEDPYHLIGFFPCAPFMLGSVGADNLYPVPDYIQLRPLLDQIHGLFRRYRVLIRALRKRGFYDASIPELDDLNSFADEAEFLGIKNFSQLVGEKGIEGLVKFFPTGELAQATVQLTQILQDFETKVNELYGVPDILRGNSDPRETAAAQQLKGQYLSLRFSQVQREFQRMCRDTIEIMCDLALKMYPDEKLAAIMGFAQMQPDDQQTFPQVLQLLKNDQERVLRIDIETDSTITMNEGAEIQQNNYLAETLFNGLNTIGQLTQNSPQFLPVAAQTVMLLVRGVRKGKDIENVLEKIFQQMMQQPEQPEGKDKDKGDEQSKQMLAQARMAEVQVKQQKLQIDAQLAQQKIMLQQAELQHKAQALLVELRKIESQTQNADLKLALEAQITEFEKHMAAMKLELEQNYLELDLMERFQTNQRLQQEADLKVMQEMNKIEGEGEKQSQAGVNINIIPGGIM